MDTQKRTNLPGPTYLELETGIPESKLPILYPTALYLKNGKRQAHQHTHSTVLTHTPGRNLIYRGRPETSPTPELNTQLSHINLRTIFLKSTDDY